jgi:hypothetical protein
MNDVTIKWLKRECKRLGYSWFTKGSFNLNIIGVRNPRGRANEWDDLLCVAYKDPSRQWQLRCLPATTDPGLYWLQNPMNVHGTAILVPGQYRRCYTLGNHKGRTAVVQIVPVKVWRDNNKDSVIDCGPRIYGAHGINIHTTGVWKPGNIDKWSAGCQVVRDRRAFDGVFLPVVRRSIHIYGPRLTYTLLDGEA